MSGRYFQVYLPDLNINKKKARIMFKIMEVENVYTSAS